MKRWTLVGLLSSFMVINFADKTVFGLAAVPIMRQFHLTNAQFGAIGSSFFLLFSVFALGIGWLSARIRPTMLLAGMAISWSIAQLSIEWVATVAGLIGMRVFLGATEGPAFPTALHVAYGHFEERRRPLVTGIILAGAPLGTALAALACTWWMNHFGWQAAFAMLGVASLLWSLLWIVLRRSSPARAETRIVPVRATIPTRLLLANRTIVGVMIASFAAYGGSALALIWLPSFLERANGIPAQAAGITLAGIVSLQIPVCLAAGWLAESIRPQARSRSAVYCWIGGISLASIGLAFIALAFTTSTIVTIALTALAGVMVVVTLTVAGPIVADITPASHLPFGLGAMTAVYALAGIAIPWAFGAIVDRSADVVAGYHTAFGLCGTLLLGSALVAAFLLRPATTRTRLSEALVNA